MPGASFPEERKARQQSS